MQQTVAALQLPTFSFRSVYYERPIQQLNLPLQAASVENVYWPQPLL